MTPKEKATELVNKMPCQIFTPSAGWVDDNETAKQCALIAVDEIIEACPIKLVGNAGKFIYIDDYWREVKKEIEKL